MGKRFYAGGSGVVMAVVVVVMIEIIVIDCGVVEDGKSDRTDEWSGGHSVRSLGFR